MSNPYYERSAFAKYTTARAAQMNAELMKVSAGFDMLPDPDAIHRIVRPTVNVGGSSNALTVDNTPPVTEYELGQRINFIAASINTGPATISVDGLPAKALVRASGAPLVAGDLSAGRVYEAVYDGTSFQLIGNLIEAGDGDLAVAVVAAQTAAAAAQLAEAGAGQAVVDGLSSPQLHGTILEQVHVITDGSSVAIAPEDGSIQTWTLGANRTPTITMAAGQSVTLMIADGAAYAVNWSSINPTWVGGSAPTLPTTGYAVIELWKVGSTIYAARVGNVA